MKNTMISLMFCAALLLFAAFAASAQNLDPTVEVSRDYEGMLMEVHKPQLRMAVPDSVLRFDLDFDYSVMDKPYKGAYEFRPYSVEMKPSSSSGSRNVFLLKAGAGYQCHPVLDMVWSPVFKKPFRMNLYAVHRSFVGDYRTEGKSWFGYDFLSKAGLDGRYDWASTVLNFELFYNGIQQKDRYYGGRTYNALGTKVGLASKNVGEGFKYDIGLGYRFGKDRLEENEIDFDACFGYGLSNGQEARLDVGLDYASVSGVIDGSACDIDLYPHYVLNYEKLRLDLGVRFSATGRQNPNSPLYGYNEQFIYPEFRLEFRVIPEILMMYLDVSGDSRVNSYSDLLEFNHHASSFYGGANFLDVEDERINAGFGMKGRVGAHFSYGIRGGYANYGNALLDAVAPVENGFVPTVGYASYEKAYAGADLLLDFEAVRFDATFEYACPWSGTIKEDSGFLLPAAFTGCVSASYNWKRRLEIGLDCEFSSGRGQGSVKIPGYADLGLNAEFKLNRKIGLWARGGNLLGMTIHRSPLFAEKWPYFTAGITLDL